MRIVDSYVSGSVTAEEVEDQILYEACLLWTKATVTHSRRTVMQDNRMKGRGCSMNLIIVLKCLLHTKCKQACLTLAVNMHTLTIPNNQLHQA